MKQLIKSIFLNDKGIQHIIGYILRTGVILSSSIALIGGFIYLSNHGSSIPHYSSFVGEPINYTSFHAILKGVKSLEGREIIQLGLIVLISTPIIRVFFSAFAFLLEKDYLYIIISLIVLAIIAFSMFSNLAG